MVVDEFGKSEERYSKYLEKNTVISQHQLSILTWLVMSFGFLKTLLYFRIFPNFGQFIRLSYNVLFAASPFSIFFYTLVLFCSVSYLILGNITGGHGDSGHDGNNYERLAYYWGVFLYSYGTSIGNLETPNAQLWTFIEKE